MVAELFNLSDKIPVIHLYGAASGWLLLYHQQVIDLVSATRKYLHKKKDTEEFICCNFWRPRHKIVLKYSTTQVNLVPLGITQEIQVTQTVLSTILASEPTADNNMSIR